MSRIRAMLFSPLSAMQRRGAHVVSSQPDAFVRWWASLNQQQRRKPTEVLYEAYLETQFDSHNLVPMLLAEFRARLLALRGRP